MERWGNIGDLNLLKRKFVRLIIDQARFQRMASFWKVGFNGGHVSDRRRQVEYALLQNRSGAAFGVTYVGSQLMSAD